VVFDRVKKTLEDKAYHLRFKLDELIKMFDTCILLDNVESGAPIFESTNGLCYFGKLSTGCEERMWVSLTGKKCQNDRKKGVLHTHIKHEAYPSYQGFRYDLEEMERSGPSTSWLIIGANPETSRAILRGYHLKPLSPNLDVERVLLDIRNRLYSEIRYDKGELMFIYQEREDVDTLIQDHLIFLN
jgi:hypothetical protein